jgi:hypothetical protein
MNRREFTALVGGTLAWPLWARAQQGGQMRHIGVLLPAPTGYVDLSSGREANMPVRAPTRHQLVINLNIAKTLGFDVPVHLRQVLDEVIE